MRTVIIWDSCGEKEVQFLVVEGDKSHLDGVYINSSRTSQDDETELLGLVFDEGRFRKMSDEFPLREFSVSLSNIKVIIAGMIP